jgi:hypothetical protein
MMIGQVQFFLMFFELLRDKKINTVLYPNE